jgi:hypothetical protein
MAKKSKRQTQPSPAPVTSVRTTDAAVAKGSSIATFWFDFSVPWQKLALVRNCMFTLLAVDALLQIRHAPRYGAGGFNVAHIWFLDDVHPSRSIYAATQLMLAFCFTAVACGAATRVMLVIATPLYSWLYFSSQVDSYQHHYLVALLLLLSCFVQWHDKEDVRGGWALRLIMVQVAIVYFWAAISKCNATWWSGTVMSQQITGTARDLIVKAGGFSVVAPITILSEFSLSALFWHRRGWPIALAIGIPLHIGIIISGLEVGVFAWLMLALYIFLVPDRLMQRLRLPRFLTATPRSKIFGVTTFIVSAVAVGIICRFPSVLGVFILLSILLFVTLIVNRGKQYASTAVCAPLAVAILYIAADRTTDVSYAYYRFWASAESRLGNIQTAKELYTEVTVRFPDQENGYYQLAKLQASSKNSNEIERALRNAQQAQRLAPTKARAFLLGARILVTQGNRPAALEQAKSAASAEPGNADAAQLLTQLRSPP